MSINLANRRFNLWQMLPKHNRRDDKTGDLKKFIDCLQQITDLLLSDIDGLADIYNIERAPDTFLDLILYDLGNPFAFRLNTISKRRLASILVDMYKQKGTATGIRNTIRFFLNIDVEAVAAVLEGILTLGESELGVDFELGPSESFSRYAFDIVAGRRLNDTDRQQISEIVNYMKPAHTHFINLIEPTQPQILDKWILGLSELGENTFLQ